jgi:predicted Mrr-cat superfamily restriction endonuclease
LIKQFLNRKKKEPSNAYVAIQYKERWTTFDNQTKANIAAKMKKLYVDTGSIGSAIKLMFDVLLNDLTFNYILASQALFLANSNQYILQIFNDMNSRHAQIIDDIASSNNKFNTRLNLQIGGATILQDRGDYFVVEYHPNGIRYNVHI